MPETTKTDRPHPMQGWLLLAVYTVICHLAGVGVALIIYNLMDC